MPLISPFILGAALLLQSAPNLSSDQASKVARTDGAEATIEDTQQYDFRSAVNGEHYRIQVYLPQKSPPPGGFPSIYVLDGDVLFGTFAAAVRNRSQAGEIEPAVVVGIAGGPDADRTLDFTSTDMTPREKALVKDLGPNPKYGGGERFFRVIQEEIKPRIASIAKVDPGRTALFGWSLGGLFVVHTMVEHPGAFQTYLALSPSLWRDDRVVFREVPGFEAAVLKDHIAPRLFIGAGSLEEDAPVGLLSDFVTHEQLAAELSYARMVGNTRDMAVLLQGFFASHDLAFATKIFADETHNSVPWTAINPILNFTLGVQTGEATSHGRP